ncbi:MAG: hypothetical protein CMK56_03665 [Proteobacteria bacterium]|nr:hypothetical protein [Pseudomonadota bacterium]
MEQVRAQSSQVQQPDIREVNKSEVSDLTPAQIRESIQWLVAKDQVEEAHKFVKKSLVLFPDNEEVLAIGSLVSVVRQDWQEAVLLLKNLYLIQGDRTAALTYQLHIRALRCNFQLDQALDMAKNGLCRFPENLEIVEDCAVLAEQLQDWKTAVVAIGILIDIKGPQNTEDLQIRLKISQDMLDKQNTEKKQKNSL